MFTFFVAAEISSNVTVPCVDDFVQYKCIANTNTMDWRITHPIQGRRDKIFRKSNPLNTSTQLNWSGFSIRLTYISGNSTSMTTVAEFIAVSQLHGTHFSCAGGTEASLTFTIAGTIDMGTVALAFQLTLKFKPCVQLKVSPAHCLLK